jgi:hypothetical protein
LQAFSQFQHTTPDSGFDGAQRLLQRLGDFLVRHSSEKAHFDGLPLLTG